MKMSAYLPIILEVLKDFRVIGTVLAMIVVISFAKYVCTYKKKPPKPKGKKVIAQSAAPQNSETSSESTAESEE